MVTTSSRTSEGAHPERLPADATEKLLKAISGPAIRHLEVAAPDSRIVFAAVETRVGQVETRLAVVETKLGALEAGVTHVEAVTLRLQDNARTDVRLFFGALIATARGLAGMMAEGFDWIAWKPGPLMSDALSTSGRCIFRHYALAPNPAASPSR